MPQHHAKFRALAADVARATGHEQMEIVQEINALSEGEPILALLDCINADTELLRVEQLKTENLWRGLATRLAEPFQINEGKHIVLAERASLFHCYTDVLRRLHPGVFNLSSEQIDNLRFINRPQMLQGLDGRKLVLHLLPGFCETAMFRSAEFQWLCQRGARCFNQFLP